MTMTTKRVPNSGQLQCFIFCYKLYYLLNWKLFWIFCPKQEQNLILMAWLHNLFVVEIGKGKEDISQCHRGRCEWWWFVPMSSDGWQGKGIDPPDWCLAAIGGVSRRWLGSHQPMLSQSCQFSLTTAVDQCQPSVGVPDSLFEDWVGQPDETDV